MFSSFLPHDSGGIILQGKHKQVRAYLFVLFVECNGPWEVARVKPNIKVKGFPPKVPEGSNDVAEYSSYFVPLSFSGAIIKYSTDVMPGIGPRISQFCIIEFGMIGAYLDPKQCQLFNECLPWIFSSTITECNA